MRKRRTSRQAGFSLIEMLIVVAIMTIVLGVILRQVVVMQTRSRTESVKLDMLQQAREGLDQLVRDVHQSGYPTKAMYQTAPALTSIDLAAGLVKIINAGGGANPEIIFEGDVDGDGQVDSVRYRLVATSTESTRCPCLERSQVVKTAADPLTGQGTAYHVLIENAQNLTFTAYDPSGAVVTIPSSGLDITNNTVVLRSIQTIRIVLQVQGQYPDMQNRQFPTAALTGLAQIRN